MEINYKKVCEKCGKKYDVRDYPEEFGFKNCCEKGIENEM